MTTGGENGYSGGILSLKLTDKPRHNPTAGILTSIINRFSAEIETIDGINGIIEFASINWTKKNFEEIFEIGDIVYVEKIDENKLLRLINGKGIN